MATPQGRQNGAAAPLPRSPPSPIPSSACVSQTTRPPANHLHR